MSGWPVDIANHERLRHRRHIRSRTDWPEHWRDQLLREVDMTSDAAIADDRSLRCIGKHWVPRYVPMSATCHYCGWTKESA